MLFMDFCSGIGGGRSGLELNNMKCIGHSEISQDANKIYQLFYGSNETNFGDLTKIKINELPYFDVLICGFPCQTFSIVGKRLGFEDLRGQIIFHIAEILKTKKVPMFLLENVKGLVNHNKGKTLKDIIELLKSCGYNVDYKVLNSLDFGVPQMRERVYIIGIRKELYKGEFYWDYPTKNANLLDFLDENNNDILNKDDATFNKYLNNKYNKGKYSMDELLKDDYTVIDWRQSDLRLYKNKVPTLRTGRHGILYVKNGQLHRLSGYEALLLQGFPKSIAEKAKNCNISNTSLLSLAGNAMTVPVIAEVCKILLKGGEYFE